MEESALPERIRVKASVSPGGEYAWRLDDVDEVILAAREVGLACLGGQLQFRFPDGTCEAHWVNFDSAERLSNEPWEHYVFRSTQEVLSKFRQICRNTDFQKVGSEWALIAQKMDQEEWDPKEHLWFPLYFKSQRASQQQ